VREILEAGIAHAWRRDEKTIDSLLRPWLADPAALVRAARALDGAGLEGREEELAALDLAAFIVWGEDDPDLPPDVAERLGDAIPGSTVALLPGCSHFVNLDAPETVGPMVFEFLRYRYLGESHLHVAEGPVSVQLERPPRGPTGPEGEAESEEA
jgi:pimeloyl-ACP methyl ester carboxylesterase